MRENLDYTSARARGGLRAPNARKQFFHRGRNRLVPNRQLEINKTATNKTPCLLLPLPLFLGGRSLSAASADT